MHQAQPGKTAWANRGDDAANIYLGKGYPRFHDCFLFNLLLVSMTFDLLGLHSLVWVYRRMTIRKACIRMTSWGYSFLQEWPELGIIII